MSEENNQQQPTTDPRSWAAWAEAFTIFGKYTERASGSIAAEHDVIYAGPDPETMAAEDKIRLIGLGWLVDTDTGSFFRFV